MWIHNFSSPGSLGSFKLNKRKHLIALISYIMVVLGELFGY